MKADPINSWRVPFIESIIEANKKCPGTIWKPQVRSKSKEDKPHEEEGDKLKSSLKKTNVTFDSEESKLSW